MPKEDLLLPHGGIFANKSGCCVGDCTFPVGRQRCNPWYPVPNDTCVPAIGDFSGSSVNIVPSYRPGVMDGLKYPFETCYAYGTTTNCYTQSWSDGLGNYYQCVPENFLGDPWSPLTFDAKDNPNLSCEEPCYDLAPATKPVKPCFPLHARHCKHEGDCCGDLVCNSVFWGPNRCMEYVTPTR